MAKAETLGYSEYGNGKNLLFAFHGYGVNGDQFRVLENSLVKNFRMVAFHLPFHHAGPETDKNWLKNVTELIKKIIAQHQVQTVSLAGYSIGCRVALHLFVSMEFTVRKLYLFAPYGLEDHWGLRFVTSRLGNAFFKLVNATNLPSLIMLLTHKMNIIDRELYEIIHAELGTVAKRTNLQRSLKMIGAVNPAQSSIRIADRMLQPDIFVVYGKQDMLFPDGRRNRKLLETLCNCRIISINEGHWLVTPRLDQRLAEITNRL